MLMEAFPIVKQQIKGNGSRANYRATAAVPKAPKNIPDTPGVLLILSPTAAMIAQSLTMRMFEMRPCLSS